MKARFIEGEGNDLAIELEPDTAEETLLLKVFCQQMEPANLLRVGGWRYSGQPPRPYGPTRVRAYIARDAKGVDILKEATTDAVRGSAFAEVLVDGNVRIGLTHSREMSGCGLIRPVGRPDVVIERADVANMAEVLSRVAAGLGK